MAKNRGESQKMTPIWKTEIFGGLNFYLGWPWVCWKLAFLAKYLPFWSVVVLCPTNGSEVPSLFSDVWVPKLLLPLQNIRTMPQKRPNLAKNMHFWSFWSKYWNFWRISSHAWPKYNANKVPRWFYRYGLSPVKNSFFALKLHNFAQNWKFWSFWASPGRLIWCPVGWLVGGCGAWAVSRTTPIYFMYNFFVNLWLVKWETLRHLSDHF